MIVSYRHGFVFVSNPKAASTSIEAALSGFDERPDLNTTDLPGFYTARHMPAIEIRERLGRDQWSGMFTFGIIRHPGDWVVSQLTYNYRRLNLAVPRDRELTADDMHRVYAILSDRRGQPASASGSQWAFLCSELGNPIVSRIVTLDSIRDGWTGLMDQAGISAPLPAKLNRTRHPDWAIWLSDDARRTAERLWEVDFELYRAQSDAAATG